MFCARRDETLIRNEFVAGELSDAQKEEIERSKSSLKEKDTQIMELKQQMAKLSEIIDRQSAEVKNKAPVVR